MKRTRDGRLVTDAEYEAMQDLCDELKAQAAVLTRMGRQPNETRWDDRPQTPDEQRLMGFLVRLAERRGVTGRCATCAFRPGTEANASGRVAEMIEECLIGGVGSFLCHHGGDINPRTGEMEDIPHQRVCAGFAAVRSREGGDAR